MNHEMKVLRSRYVTAMVICFVTGLLVGLVLHLPAVSFMDDVTQEVVMEITDSNSWSGDSVRLNGKPVGRVRKVQEQTRSLTNADVSVRVNTPQVVTTVSAKPAFVNLDDIVDGVFWSDNMEQRVPKGFTDDDINLWRNFARSNNLVNMADGCGRMQNRLLTFADGSQSCARYRINTDQIQGEVYTFHLSRLLGIKNLAPLVLLTANQRDSQWSKISSQLTDAKWSEDKPIVMTKFIRQLEAAYIPPELRADDRHLLPNRDLLTRSSDDLIQLVQWSDLVILDYLTGNLDRVVNNMFNKQWNSEIMDNPVHNLERSSNLLIFLDNESGLFHGYRLLDKYQEYHKKLLDALCLFRKETIFRLREFHDNQDSLGDAIHLMVRTMEPHHHVLPAIPRKNLKVLEQRISDVLEQVDKCRSDLVR